MDKVLPPTSFAVLLRALAVIIHENYGDTFILSDSLNSRVPEYGFQLKYENERPIIKLIAL